jgi:hypothetical protein
LDLSPNPSCDVKRIAKMNKALIQNCVNQMIEAGAPDDLIVEFERRAYELERKEAVVWGLYHAVVPKKEKPKKKPSRSKK